MRDEQRFVSALPRPWALIRVQGNGQPGRRPPTTVAWLEWEEDGHYLGGPVWQPRPPYRSRLLHGHWAFRYRRQQKIDKDRVLHFFPIGKWDTGPTASMVRSVKAALPVIEA